MPLARLLKAKIKEIMKKLVSKIRTRKQPKEPVGRITNDTLAEHREKVLAGGRKFKYPIQYARHKLVINAAIIGVSAIVVLFAVSAYLLYGAQNTSEFMYRVTKVAPVPVASVDGQSVRYSEYLMKYRSALHYLVEKERIDMKTDDGKRQQTFIKDSSMNDAIADAYAHKLAKEHDLTVSAEEVDTFLKSARQADGEEFSEAAQAGVIADYYNWTMAEYRGIVADKLLRQKVSYQVDDKAKGIVASVEKAIATEGAEFKDVAASLNVEKKDTVVYMPASWVPKTNRDGGLAEVAAGLEKGEVSKALKGPGDGYYFVKLIDSNETDVQYEYIQVPLTAFTAQLAAAKDAGKVKYYIKLEPVQTQDSKKGE